MNFVPYKVKRAFQAAHRRIVFWNSIAQFRKVQTGDDVDIRLLKKLVYGWGNESWSIDHQNLAETLRWVSATTGPILECGSGLTTLLVGMLGFASGRHLWSLEHDPVWAERTQKRIGRLGIVGVHLRLTDLRDYGSYSWYSPPLAEMPSDFGLVLCDGPPGTTHGGRYGLLPTMHEKLAPDCVVLLDDATREGEHEIMKRWSEEFHLINRDKGSDLAVLQFEI